MSRGRFIRAAYIMSSRKYTDKQKIAYYKKLAAGRPATVRGRGAYKPDKGKEYYKRYRALKAAGRAGDGESDYSLGSAGSQLGGWLGHGAQKVIKSIFGFGDYGIEANTCLMGGMSPPEIVNTVKREGVILRHREYICDITATTAFTNQTFDINPGLYASFPWLSQVAKAFELYRLRGLVYEFKSTSSDTFLSGASSGTALGTVIMATQYNSLNPGFTNALQMENHEFANAAKPSVDFYHPVECKKSLIPASELYIRDGAVPSGGDIRLFDLGQFNIATTGMQSNAGVLGQLWCTYEVEFYQHAFTAPATILTDHIINSSCTSAAPLGASHSFATGNSLGLGITSTTITFPTSVKVGKFMVLMRYIRAAAAFVAPTINFPPVGTFNILQYWCDASNPDQASNGNSADGTSGTFHLAYIVEIVGPNLPVTLTFGTAGTISSSIMDLWVTQIDSDIAN